MFSIEFLHIVRIKPLQMIWLDTKTQTGFLYTKTQTSHLLVSLVKIKITLRPENNLVYSRIKKLKSIVTWFCNLLGHRNETFCFVLLGSYQLNTPSFIDSCFYKCEFLSSSGWYSLRQLKSLLYSPHQFSNTGPRSHEPKVRNKTVDILKLVP